MENKKNDYGRLTVIGNKIAERGYSLNNICAIMQDKNALIILVWLLVRALFSPFFVMEKKMSFFSCGHTVRPSHSVYRSVGFRKKDFFLLDKFCNSL